MPFAAYEETNKADENVEVNEVDKTNEAVKARQSFEARVTNKAEANKSVVFVKLPVMHPFSLTKCTTIFTEVKGCLGIFNNLPGGLKIAGSF